MASSIRFCRWRVLPACNVGLVALFVAIPLLLNRWSHSGGKMSNAIRPDDTQLKVYTMLVDQIQKYNTILWQFPAAVLAANFLALDKFSPRPHILFCVAALDCILAYVFQRLVAQQKAIIKASRNMESVLKLTSYAEFVPNFGSSRFH